MNSGNTKSFIGYVNPEPRLVGTVRCRD